MMDFDNLTIKTKFCNYIPITIDDCKSIIDIRSSRNDSVLNPIDYSLDAQEEYFHSYYKRFINKDEVYFKIMLLDSNSPLGLVRITELDYHKRFNYQSLIFKENTPAYMPIDTIFSMYELGFIKFNKDICGPWMVPKSGTKVFKLHKKMGIASEIMSTDDEYYFMVTREKFLSRRSFFKKLGFGLKE